MLETNKHFGTGDEHVVNVCSNSMTEEVGPLSCTRQCLNGTVLIVEVINHVMQKYVKGVQHFNSLRVFIEHAHEQYDKMITFIQIVYTFHI